MAHGSRPRFTLAPASSRQKPSRRKGRKREVERRRIIKAWTTCVQAPARSVPTRLYLCLTARRRRPACPATSVFTRRGGEGRLRTQWRRRWRWQSRRAFLLVCFPRDAAAKASGSPQPGGQARQGAFGDTASLFATFFFTNAHTRRQDG